jgi:hypothetical protein
MSDAIEPEVVEQNTEPQKVTASLSTEVSFNPQVADADTAIKNRNTATKNARAKWVALAKRTALPTGTQVLCQLRRGLQTGKCRYSVAIAGKPPQGKNLPLTPQCLVVHR